MLIYASAVSSSAVCEVFLGVKWLDRKRAECHLQAGNAGSIPATSTNFKLYNYAKYELLPLRKHGKRHERLHLRY